MSRAPLVHFTHHLCLVADSKSEIGERDAFFGSQSRTPDVRGVGRCRFDGRMVQRAFSIDGRKVTCSKCRVGRAQDAERPWLTAHNETYGRYRHRKEDPLYHWVNDRELVFRAWYGCCRHHGCEAPRGFDTDSTVKRWDAASRERKLRRATHSLTRTRDAAADTRKDLTVAVETLDADTLAMIEGAIDELRMVGDVLAEVDRMRTRAWRAINEARKQILEDGGVDVSDLGHYLGLDDVEEPTELAQREPTKQAA